MAKNRQTPTATATAQLTPLGEDPELLEPAEEALLQSGNSGAREPAAADYATDEGAPGTPEPDEAEATAGENQTPQPAAAEEAAGEPERIPGPNDTVPAWSLVRERQENRELKRQLEETARKLREQEAAWARLEQRIRQAQEQDLTRAFDPEPDAQADPAAHQQWELRQQRRALAELHQQQQLSTARNQAIAQQTLLASMEQQFVAAGHPDYFERVNFIRQRRDRELTLMGYGDAAERARIIRNEGQMLVAGAVRQGRNPAEVVHELAEHWGYRAEPAAPAARSALARIRDAGRNQAAAQSLQAVAGRPPEGPLTLEDFAAMDDETYERYLDKAGGDLSALLRR
jgi:hypothetical protein